MQLLTSHYFQYNLFHCFLSHIFSLTPYFLFILPQFNMFFFFAMLLHLARRPVHLLFFFFSHPLLLSYHFLLSSLFPFIFFSFCSLPIVCFTSLSICKGSDIKESVGCPLYSHFPPLSSPSASLPFHFARFLSFLSPSYIFHFVPYTKKGKHSWSVCFQFLHSHSLCYPLPPFFLAVPLPSLSFSHPYFLTFPSFVIPYRPISKGGIMRCLLILFSVHLLHLHFHLFSLAPLRLLFIHFPIFSFLLLRPYSVTSLCMPLSICREAKTHK